MEVNIDNTPWYDRPWAAFLFFTRLPLWRLHQPTKVSYRSVVEYWPLVGWLTGGIMGAVIYFGSMLFPYAIALLLAIVVRMLLTGALHEDGLADFIDGFGGGGRDRQRVLDIMKDSRIGTYGVLGLLLYVLLLFFALFTLPPKGAALAVVAADPFAKMVASQLVMLMPYARTEEQAKSKVVYRRIGTAASIGLAVQGLVPMIVFLYLTGLPWQTILFVPALIMYVIYLLVWRRLRGYTGDCCGAAFLLVELTVYLAICSQYASLPVDFF